jgi:hypothetical protein
MYRNGTDSNWSHLLAIAVVLGLLGDVHSNMTQLHTSCSPKIAL